MNCFDTEAWSNGKIMDIRYDKYRGVIKERVPQGRYRLRHLGV